MFAVFYALIGIPLFVITSAQLGLRLKRICAKFTARIEKKIKHVKWKSVVSLLMVFTLGKSARAKNTYNLIMLLSISQVNITTVIVPP